ncbi:MAG: stage III sporulation protein AE [Roseburia sp.]
MKKVNWFAVAVCAFCLLFALLGGQDVQAAQRQREQKGGTSSEDSVNSYLDIWLEKLDFTDLDALLETQIFQGRAEKYLFSDLVGELLADGIGGFDYTRIFKWAGDALFFELSENRKIMIEVVFLAVGFAVLRNFSGAFRSAYISEICFLLVYCILAVMLLESFSMYGTIVEETLGSGVNFMKALVPTFCISMVFSAGVETSAGFYQLAFLVIYLIQWLFLKVLMPVIHIYIILELFNHFFEDEKFQNLTELLKSAANWGMKTAGILVLGLNVVQTIVSPAKDRLVGGTITRAASFIPGVGTVLNGVGELLLGSGILIKNCVGAAALILLILLGVMPVLKLLGMSLFYKLAAVVIEPMSDRRITGCLKGMAEGGALYLKLVLYCIALLFVTVALTTAASGVV